MEVDRPGGAVLHKLIKIRGIFHFSRLTYLHIGFIKIPAV
jgi:hypothetical protein